MADDQAPVAIPWYKSKILQGVVTGIVAQLISRLQSQYHLDLTVYGLTANDLVSGIRERK